jgi:hypothetical protein
MKKKWLENDGGSARRGGQRCWRSALVVAAALGWAHAAKAADYYVAPAGSDSAAGTMAAPWASLAKAASTAAAGDTVYFREGSYPLTAQTKLAKSGTSDSNRIAFAVYPGEHAILDCSHYRTTNAAADTPCILVTGSYLHLQGFEIVGAPVGASGDHSISTLRCNGGSNNIYELLDIHDGFGPGLFIDTGQGGNLILNCDSHDNYDKDGSQGDGQNADGFGVHYQTTGPSTIIRGCRAWLNSDDGYDLISQEVPVTIENSWAFQNGYADGGATSPADGNGNGFKAGSSQTGIRHLVQNDVAWKNKASGFYANHSSGGNTWLNNTSYMNGTQYNMLASPPGDSSQTITLTGDQVHRMRNNVGFPNKNSNMGGVDSASNSWDLNVSETNAFVSTTDTGATGPRQNDGSLPDLDFLKPKPGGVLIDRGVDVMLPYVGAAPDLGAYEYGAVASGGTGGTTSTSGAGGAGASAAGDAGRGSTAGGAGTTGRGGAPGHAGAPSSGVGGSSDTAGAGGGSTVAAGRGGMGVTAGSSGAMSALGGGTGTGGDPGQAAGGTAGTSGSTMSVSGATGAVASEAAPDDTADRSGCGCSVPSRTAPEAPALFAAVFGLLGFACRRLRSRRPAASATASR